MSTIMPCQWQLLLNNSIIVTYAFVKYYTIQPQKQQNLAPHEIVPAITMNNMHACMIVFFQC